MKLFIQEETLNEIGNAIREKTETSDLIAPGDMPGMIRGIESGGGGYEPTDEELTLTNNCQYKFSYNTWNWVIQNYGHRITTNDIIGMNSMFKDSNLLTEIPFDINGAGKGMYIAEMFCNCYNLRSIDGKMSNIKPNNGNRLFNSCYNLRKMPVMENWDWSAMHTQASQSLSEIFSNCYSLRVIPEDWLKEIYNAYTSHYGSPYYNMFSACHCLDELRGVPVARAKYSSNSFRNTFFRCGRLKEVIFDTDNGTPYTVNWSNQEIDLTTVGIGYSNKGYLLDYNSGITADKEVTDAASYEALKYDPDWFTCMTEYSRYNHDSAVNTINSLPTTTGTGCVIKFAGAAGSATDGGAINTLTEEEIAIAAAKGWTVSFT